jgi:hypothetical protein
MDDALASGLVVGAVARLTRLVTKDTITAPARDWIEAKAKKAGGRKLWSKLDDLVNCPWCVSVWVSAPVALAATLAPRSRLVRAGLLALTSSWLAANVQAREPDDTAEDATSVANLVEAGFTLESATAAIRKSDITRLRFINPPTQESRS